MEIIVVILYLIGVLTSLSLGIHTLKQKGGTVKELFVMVALSLTSWLVIISLFAAYIQDKIEYSKFWNKQIFK